jgi:hypothetical protein
LWAPGKRDFLFLVPLFLHPWEQIEIVAYEDDEKDRITVVGPADVSEAFAVWRRGKADPLKMWVRAIGPLVVIPTSQELHGGDDSYWNDRDVGSADVLSFAPPQPFAQVVQNASAARFGYQ